MKRRSLLLGMGAALAGPGLAPAESLTRDAGFPWYRGQIATRCYINSRSAGYNAELTRVMGRVAHVAMDDIAALRFVYCNWGIHGGTGLEENGGAVLTVRAGIEYPEQTFGQITSGGSPELVIPPGATLVSDDCPVSIPRGAIFFSRSDLASEAGFWFPSARYSAGLGDRMSFDKIDQSVSGVINDELPGYAIGPNLIIAITKRRSAYLLGTSRTFGSGDTPDDTGHQGLLARSIGPANAYLNAGNPSDQTRLFAASYEKRLSLARYFSDIFFEYGANDGEAAGVVAASLQTIYEAFAAGGRRLHGVTVDPFTTGANEAADGSDQTVARDYTELNAWLKTVPAPLSFVHDIASSVSLAAAPTKWKPGFVANEGGTLIHANQAAELARATANGPTIQAIMA